MTILEPEPPMAPRKIVIESATKLHLEWLDRLEQAFEAIVLRSLKRAVRPIARKFNTVTAQGEPGEAMSSADDLAQIRTIWASEVSSELIPLLGDVFMTGAQGVSLAVAGSSDVPDVVSIGAQQWLSNSANRLNRIGDTAWLAARQQLLEGFQAGESIDELAKRVRSAIDVTTSRARTVARTEVIGASNAGSFAQAHVIGATSKTWLNTDDARTRPTHVRAGEQTVGIDEPFIVGGSRLRFPHDPLGPPGETINCRCTILFDDSPLCACTPGWVRREVGPLNAAGEPDCGCSDTIRSSGDPIGLVTFHLPGKHAQPTHGGGKSSKKTPTKKKGPPKITYKPSSGPLSSPSGGGGGGGGSKPKKSTAPKKVSAPSAKTTSTKTPAAATPGGPKGTKVKRGKINEGERVRSTKDKGFESKEFGKTDEHFDKSYASNWGTDSSEGWRDSLNDKQRTSLDSYTDGGFIPINRSLRGQSPDPDFEMSKSEINRHVSGLDSSFKKSSAKLPENITVHRGVQGPMARDIHDAFSSGKLITSSGGSKIRDPGYMSTSLDYERASSFSGANVGKTAVVMSIRVPKGTNAVYPNGLSKFPGEHEVILPRGSQLEILSGVVDSRGVLNVEARIVGG